LNNHLIAAPYNGHRQEMPTEKIRLNSNENPYGPSPLARQAMVDAVVSSNRYAWETGQTLRINIAKTFALSPENVLLGAGSSEILGLAAQLAALKKGNIVAANQTFRIWMNAAEKLGLQIIRVPLTNDKKHDLSSMLRAVNKETSLVYICNPNNPTGTIVPSVELKSFVEELSKSTMVLLDEAYIEYCDEPSLAELIVGNKNLIVAKTFSKFYGLAGARLGYALAHPETIKRLSALQPWENAGASAVSIAGANASLTDNAFKKATKQKNIETKEFVYSVYNELHIPYTVSYTNFLTYSVKDFTGNFIAALTEHNILAGRIIEEEGKWARITIGTLDEMKTYLNILKQIWK
jgi:histidinol-phosphate aminotransferase